MKCDVGIDVARAAGLISEGKLVALPTETVYGLACHALDTTAVAAVFAAKERPTFDPLIVHVTSTAGAADLTTNFSDMARALAERFWPGPLTLVLPKVAIIPDLVTSGLPTVALRVPSHSLAREVIERAGVPVAAPSANLFGQVSPTTAEHVAEQLGHRIDYILDGGPCTIGIESTVVHLAGNRPMLLRPGGISIEEIEAEIGPLPGYAHAESGPQSAQPAPGMLDRHYAPHSPLVIVEDLREWSSVGDCGLLTLKPVQDSHQFARTEILSATGDLTAAAAGFYAAIRRLDAAGVSQIVAIRFPDHGLGRALNDRLRRAAHTATT